MDYYSRKLYALLHEGHGSHLFAHLDCFNDRLEALQQWWDTQGKLASELASTTDRINLGAASSANQAFEIHHPISGQKLENAANKPQPYTDHAQLITKINTVWHSIADPEPEARMQQLFTWCWRFVPESSGRSLLTPADRVLPDTALHSHNSAVSALTGALFPPDWQGGEPDRPYLVLFTFSPIQEFIKASRKFLDFWAGSYLLHYLSAILCWEAAQQYGADAIITPSLWSQEIIDALIAQTYPAISAEINIVDRFYHDRNVAPADRSLSTINIAGFPNTITLLAPNREAADQLVATLKAKLQNHWQSIAIRVKETVKSEVREFLNQNFDRTYADLSRNLDPEAAEALAIELKQYQQPGCWEWNALWDAQIDHTWETYAVAVPLGHPQQALTIANLSQPESESLTAWIAAQTAIANPRDTLPTTAESSLYQTFNVGSWWGSYQARLGQLIQAVKNTRNWQIPVAPGERSSISGLYSALHPRLLYRDRFRNGCGVANSSLKLFWQLMALVYPGLFNGSERLNAIELTKRMAWKYGGIAASLGIDEVEVSDLLKAPDVDRTIYTAPDAAPDLRDFDDLIRFPNLSSIAAARFAHDHPDQVKEFWRTLSRSFQQGILKSQYRKFCQLTRRPFQIGKVDRAIAQGDRDIRYNGVMFSSKWLADDLQLDADQTVALRQAVAATHQQHHFGDTSPSDWWVLVLGDGDGMGNYVNGSRLKPYADYLETDWVDRTVLNDTHWTDLLETRKRMGPGTHVGLNRALLDFSNRLVPYLTEERCCGRVIYSGGDDVMVALPLADLPNFLRSLRAAWSGSDDPAGEFEADGGYWKAFTQNAREIMGDRSLFTMGKDATMSLGVVIAHKSAPLPTVLELLWEAEKERAKKLLGGSISKAHGRPDSPEAIIPAKDGLCFRVVYGSGNVLESHLKGHLLEGFTQLLATATDRIDLAPVLYRLATELPLRCQITPDLHLLRTAASVILNSRDLELPDLLRDRLLDWLDQWEIWAWTVIDSQKAALSQQPHLSAIAVEAEARRSLGTRPEDLAALLRFAAFWISRRQQELNWTASQSASPLVGARRG